MFGPTMTVRFEEVKLQAKKSGKCPCGKRKNRQTTFYQTINPFHTIVKRYKEEGKNPENYLRDIRREIMEDLKKEAEEWKNIPVHCDRKLSYYKLSEDDRNAYNAGKEIEVELVCGSFIKIKK